MQDKPSWHVSKAHQLLNLIEGVPATLSGLNLEEYNYSSIILLFLIDERIQKEHEPALINLKDILINTKPTIVNFDLVASMHALVDCGDISTEAHAEFLIQYALADSLSFTQTHSIIEKTKTKWRKAKRNLKCKKQQALIIV